MAITKQFSLPAIAIFHHSEHIVSLAGPPDRSLEALGRLRHAPNQLVIIVVVEVQGMLRRGGHGKMHKGGGPTEGRRPAKISGYLGFMSVQIRIRRIKLGQDLD